MSVTISIILPVYNGEATLEGTLESIFSQTFRDFEVIAVDDGSRDATGDILARAAMRYGRERFKVIRQENRGVSLAREAGVLASSGEAVLFFDADDVMAPRMLEDMAACRRESGADLVICGYQVVDDEGRFVKAGDVPGASCAAGESPAADEGSPAGESSAAGEGSPAGESPAAGESDISGGEFFVWRRDDRESYRKLFSLMPFPGNKLYDRRVIREAQLSFTPGMSVGEDLEYYLSFLLSARKAAILPEALCSYRRGSSSVSRCADARMLEVLSGLDRVQEKAAILEDGAAFSEALWGSRLLHAYYQLCKYPAIAGRREQKRLFGLLSREVLEAGKHVERPNGAQRRALKNTRKWTRLRFLYLQPQKARRAAGAKKRLTALAAKGKRLAAAPLKRLRLFRETAAYKRSRHTPIIPRSVLFWEGKESGLSPVIGKESGLSPVIGKESGLSPVIGKESAPSSRAGKESPFPLRTTREDESLCQALWDAFRDGGYRVKKSGKLPDAAFCAVLVAESVLPPGFAKREGQAVIKLMRAEEALPLPTAGDYAAADEKKLSAILKARSALLKTCLKADILLFPSAKACEEARKALPLDAHFGGRMLICGGEDERRELAEVIVKAVTHPETAEKCPEWEKAVCGLDRLGNGAASENPDRPESPAAPGSMRKPNIFIYGGNMKRNGLTAALKNLAANLDAGSANITIGYREDRLLSPESLSFLPEGMEALALCGFKEKTPGELLSLNAYYHSIRLPGRFQKLREDFYRRLFEANLGGFHFDQVVQFYGFDRDVTHILMKAPGRKLMWIHSDLDAEISVRRTLHKETIREALCSCDAVCAVTPPMLEKARRLYEEGYGKNEASPSPAKSRTEPRFLVVPNAFDSAGVRKRAGEPLRLPPGGAIMAGNPQKRLDEEQVLSLLSEKGPHIITLGRFSEEKGHALLIGAFARYLKDYPGAYLFIAGGHGDLYGKTLALASRGPLKGRVILIRGLDNPMPLLARCSLYVQPSLFEALGLAMLEADCLGILVLATDLPGPRSFLAPHGGIMVPPSEEGLYQGLLLYSQGDIRPMNIDYNAYNASAICAFRSALEKPEPYTRECENDRW